MHDFVLFRRIHCRAGFVYISNLHCLPRQRNNIAQPWKNDRKYVKAICKSFLVGLHRELNDNFVALLNTIQTVTVISTGCLKTVYIFCVCGGWVGGGAHLNSTKGREIISSFYVQPVSSKTMHGFPIIFIYAWHSHKKLQSSCASILDRFVKGCR